MTSSLTHMTLAEARGLLLNKEITSVELTQAHLDAIEKANPHLNAYITVTPEIALAQARKADEKLQKGQHGLIEGVPVAVKDLFCTRDMMTTAASHILNGFTPPYESTVTQKCWEQGGVLLGKTNLDEFAMGSSNKTSYYGAAKNPWKRTDGAELTPGGSSGGSAAAVAAHLAPVSLGTDTGGSIRQPAAYCGIVGIKPSYGRCSRWGIIAYASSLDQAGPFARNVRDAAIMLSVISGYDAKDSTSADTAVPDFEALLTGDIKGKKIGIPREYRIDGTDPEILALWDKGAQMLKDAGAEVTPISLPHTRYALPTYYVLAPAEASSNLARYDGVRYGLRVQPENGNLDAMYEATRAAGFGAEVQRRILIGTYVLSAGYYDAYYKKAQAVRALILQDFEKAFEKVDAILTPTTPSAAFALNETVSDPVQMYLNDVFTITANLAGLPAISIPAGLSRERLPLGLQLLSRPFEEASLLNIAHSLEQSLGFAYKPGMAA